APAASVRSAGRPGSWSRSTVTRGTSFQHCFLGELHVRSETVAATPMGLDEGGVARVQLDLLAQPADLVVDAAVIDIGGTAHSQIEERVGRQHQARPLDKTA